MNPIKYVPWDYLTAGYTSLGHYLASGTPYWLWRGPNGKLVFTHIHPHPEGYAIMYPPAKDKAQIMGEAACKKLKIH